MTSAIPGNYRRIAPAPPSWGRRPVRLRLSERVDGVGPEKLDRREASGSSE
jgi:hypothetical protein